MEVEIRNKECRKCGVEFRPRKTLQVYCSMACYLDYVTKNKPRKCANCGAIYKPYTGSNSIKSKYCSTGCSGLARRTGVERKCRNCGKMFSFKPSQLNHYKGAGKYCSRDCSYAGIVKTNVNKPVNDRYGRTRRKADVEWARAIKEKYDYTCQRCGVRNEVIHAHHKATRGAHPELKHDLDNGITLCNSCHTWVHHHPAISYEKGWMSRG